MAKLEKIEEIRHSLAHLLAAAVLKKFPKAKLGIGPVIENGFYYDFKLPRPLTEADLKELEHTMRALIMEKLPFSGKKITPAAAKKLFKDQPFKLDLIKDFQKERKPLTVYETGFPPSKKSKPNTLSPKPYFVDLCRGGHVKNTSEINTDSFKLTSIAGAYWRGDEKNPQLQRIYGAAFITKKELDEYFAMLEEAKRRDHKKLGVDLDLFTFSDLVGAGLPLWTPRGTLVRNLLDNFVWELRKRVGYEQVDIPHITKKDLYERSGHWEKFKDDLFKIQTREGHLFAMKPMNCPHHTQIYARKPWSYRDLPQRYANTTKVYRDEQTGELAGLSRVRAITQDDAHVFCRLSQTKEEFLKIWDIVQTFYGSFGFKLRIRVSTHDPKHPEKYLGDKKKWKFAEDMLYEIARSKRADTFDGIGEAAFYGPKLDFMAKDSLGREWQVATIQLDVNMPDRFDLTCTNEEGKPERIVMIHAAIMGSIERFLSVIIEHLAGDFPVWLSPIQARIIPISEKHLKYAEELRKKMKEQNLRIDIASTGETLSKNIRQGELEKIPYLLVVGDKEIEAKSVNVRERHKKETSTVPIEKFIEKIKKEDEEKNRGEENIRGGA
ncbi:threonine--tRNA ligase [Patescibacteria group bacterium]|nr:threonine--tRNA ligase [Patescibacteria group bacterium]MCL5114527.1 threonine--tRNA ligase [Patescibacteria group bacterium]